MDGFVFLLLDCVIHDAAYHVVISCDGSQEFLLLYKFYRIVCFTYPLHALEKIPPDSTSAAKDITF